MVLLVLLLEIDILLADGLRDVLERFAAMLQSGKDVFIDEHTILKVYTFTPPSGGSPNTPMFAAMKDDLYKRSKSIVLIKNPGMNTSFAKAFVLGLKQLDDKKERVLRFS